MISRRDFLGSVSLAGALPFLNWQTPANEWGSPVFDLHCHMRQQPASTSP